VKPSKLLPLIGIALFIYIIYSIDIMKVGEIIVQINPLYFTAAILVTTVAILLKAFKWQLLFSVYGIKVPYYRFLRSWMIGLTLSMITPGKVGDFAKACYLKDKAPLGKGLTTVMSDRIIDLLTLFILTIIGLSVFAIYYAENTSLLLTTYILFALFIIAVFIFSKKRIASFILRPFYYRFAPEKYKEKLKSVYVDFYSGISLVLEKKKLVIIVTALTFIVWFVTTFTLYMVSSSLNFSIPFSFLLIVFPIITLLEALPISFSGVGTRDAALIFFFSFITMGAEASISISLIYLLTTYVFVFIGFGLWYRNPIKLTD